MFHLKYCLVVAVLVQFVTSVDRNAFKKCSESGFCKRHRDFKYASSPYQAQFDSISLSNSQFTCNVLDISQNILFKLELFVLDNNKIRFKFNELNPLKKRYEVENSLVGEPKRISVTYEKIKADLVKVKSNDNKRLHVLVYSSPLKIEFYDDDQLMVTFNEKSLLKFEHLRVKPAPTENQNVDANKTEESKEEPDMWEETFKTHTDSKPHGPEAIGMDIVFNDFENVYGIPEHADSFSLKSTVNTDPYRLFNLDVFEYELYNPMALYGSIPYMIAHNEKKTIGCLWLNAAETWIDIKSSKADKVTDFLTKSNEINEIQTHWISESGVIDVFLMFGPTARDVFKQYAELTGVTPLPPIFSIAYHQCRWNYNDDTDVRNVNAGFEEHQIPYDVLWLDIEHTDGKRYFTWDNQKFPNPEDTLNHIASFGRKMVTIIDPHIKVDSNYKIYSEAKDKGYFVKDKNGNDMEGWCWPGQSSWLDFLSEDVRKWHASKFLLSEYKGSTLDLYTWNDMNEMSVFSGPEITANKDSLHHGGWENRDVHNMYGMLQAMSTYDGHLMRSDGNRRPFILSRSFFVGSQRAGAIWTGDNMAEWEHLKVSIPMLLSLSVTGITHCGADVGGFFKNPDSELLVRWYQAGAYQPFFRAHAHIDTKRREPWLFDQKTTDLIRDAVQSRYALLYYWYTLFYINEQTGVPPMLPLWANYPEDKSTFAMDDQFMVGDGLLVKPVTTAGASSIDVYFPGNNELWYDIKTFQVYEGRSTKTLTGLTLANVPVFQRGGSIIPYKYRFRRSSTQMFDDPFTLIVALNKNQTSSGELYFDDGLTFNYKKNQEFVHRSFKFDQNTLTSTNLQPGSKIATRAWVERVIVYGLERQPSTVKVESEGQSVRLEYTYDDNLRVLLIRKPDVKIDTDWKIVFV